jgi:hypothetical protein
VKKIGILIVAIAACWVCVSLRREQPAAAPESEEPTAAGPGAGRVASGSDGSAKSDSTTKPEAGMDYGPQLDEILLRDDPLRGPLEFGSVFWQWQAEDFEAALAYLRRMPRRGGYTEGVRMVLERLQSSDPERAVALMGELVTPHDDMHIYHYVFARLAADRPGTAVRLADQVPEGEPRSNAIRAVASVWAQSDVESALNWGASLLVESERELAVESALLARADEDPQGALDAARQYLKGESLRRVIEPACLSLIEKNPQVARETLKTIPSSMLSKRVMTEMARAMDGLGHNLE